MKRRNFLAAMLALIPLPVFKAKAEEYKVFNLTRAPDRNLISVDSTDNLPMWGRQVPGRTSYAVVNSQGDIRESFYGVIEVPKPGLYRLPASGETIGLYSTYLCLNDGYLKVHVEGGVTGLREWNELIPVRLPDEEQPEWVEKLLLRDSMAHTVRRPSEW